MINGKGRGYYGKQEHVPWATKHFWQQFYLQEIYLAIIWNFMLDVVIASGN